MTEQLSLDLYTEPCWAQGCDVVNELTLRYSPRALTSIPVIDGPEDACRLLAPLIKERADQEQVWVVPLSSRSRPKGVYLATIGTVSSAPIHPREVFRIAIASAASTVLLAHNHPGGDPCPSSADYRATRTLRDTGQIIGIELFDHVILGSPQLDPLGVGFYSFRRAGMI